MNRGVTLVTGATGTQGGATARALLARRRPVRALVRDPQAAAALRLKAAGAELAVGDLDEPASLVRAAEGAIAVFSVQQAPLPSDRDRERRHADALIEAARRAGVGHFVQTSVSNTGDFRTMPGWAEGHWERNYWESKADVERAVRSAGFTRCTILRPAFMMDNFARPKAAWMFPDLVRREILTAVEPATRIPLVAAEDIAAAALKALDDPSRFAGAAHELAGDCLTLREVAAILSRVKGLAVIARTLSPSDLVARGQNPGWVEAQLWQNVVGYPARPKTMEGLGLAPTSFSCWVGAHAESIAVG